MTGARTQITVLLVLAVLLTGCAPAPGANPPAATGPVASAPAVTPPPVSETATMAVVTPTVGDTKLMPPTPQPQTSPGLDGLVDQARRDLAARLAIPETQIQLVEANLMVWPDASIGCPQPGMEYIQVPQDGAQIILEAGGQRYDYHAGGRRGLFLCETGYQAPKPPTPIDLLSLTPRPPANPTPDNSIPPGGDT